MQSISRSLRVFSARTGCAPKFLVYSSLPRSCVYRPSQLSPSPLFRSSITSPARFNSSVAAYSSADAPAPPKPKEPSYQLTFTCKPCQTRSSHVITKHGYHKGTVLITCSGCQSRHIISDHLKIFMDERSTLEDILKRTAGTDKDITKLLKKGTLGQKSGQLVGNEGEADIEFWDDGTQTPHKPAHETTEEDT